MPGTIRNHGDILVPIDIGGSDRSGNGPCARLVESFERIAGGFNYRETLHEDTAFGIDIAIAAVVPGRILHGGADRKFNVHILAERTAQTHKNL